MYTNTLPRRAEWQQYCKAKGVSCTTTPKKEASKNDTPKKEKTQQKSKEKKEGKYLFVTVYCLFFYVYMLRFGYYIYSVGLMATA